MWRSLTIRVASVGIVGKIGCVMILRFVLCMSYDDGGGSWLY